MLTILKNLLCHLTVLSGKPFDLGPWFKSFVRHPSILLAVCYGHLVQLVRGWRREKKETLTNLTFILVIAPSTWLGTRWDLNPTQYQFFNLLTSGRLNPSDHLFMSLIAPMVYVSAVGKRLLVMVACVCVSEGSLLCLNGWGQPCIWINSTICKETCYYAAHCFNNINKPEAYTKDSSNS